MNNPDHISKSLETTFGLKYGDKNSFMRIWDGKFSDPGFGMEKFGSGINIPDPQLCYL
jgi:hypothetical protein